MACLSQYRPIGLLHNLLSHRLKLTSLSPTNCWVKSEAMSEVWGYDNVPHAHLGVLMDEYRTLMECWLTGEDCMLWYDIICFLFAVCSALCWERYQSIVHLINYTQCTANSNPWCVTSKYSCPKPYQIYVSFPYITIIYQLSLSHKYWL
jgi:hypothetical protein